MNKNVSVAIGFCIAVSLLAIGGVRAASVPAWLDDAISDWNDNNRGVQIEFVDIKDSYVWYMIPDTEETGHREIRKSVHELVLTNGYKVTADEELVTTGKPPSLTSPYREKKCWTRSFVLDVEQLSNTTSAGSRGQSGMRQRMLTSMVCDDGPQWFAGFRILQ